MSLEIVFENELLIAINKPHGLLVHKSSIAKDATEFAVQMLRNQIKQRVYLTHRLDRKTSGVLLFAKNKETNKFIQKQFRDGQMFKVYHAIVRGYIIDYGQIDYALKNENKIQNSLTNYKLLKHFEIDVPHLKFPTSRYSLVELTPQTGRFHQLRKHMAHIFHPIIGDRPHGCNKQNKLWKERFGMQNMMLHASSLSFTDENQQSLNISAPYQIEFINALKFLDQQKNPITET